MSLYKKVIHFKNGPVFLAHPVHESKSYSECLWSDVWTDSVTERDERLGEMVKQNTTIITRRLTLTNT